VDRYDIAWRIWCYKQGWNKNEIDGRNNWLRMDDAQLAPEAVENKAALLSIADDILASLPGHKKTMANPGYVINFSEPEPRIIPVVVRDPRMRS
jgi:hypothetical protein